MTDAAKKPRDLPNVHASFDSAYLDALGLILDSAEERCFGHHHAGLFIEPAEQGGVYLIATDGATIGVFHDERGHANAAFHPHLPRTFRDRCAPPEPIHMFSEGCIEIDLPEWAQPGDVHLFGIMAMLSGKMPHPAYEAENAPCLANYRVETGNVIDSEDYRVEIKTPPNWRKALAFHPAQQPEGFFDPLYVSFFAPIFRLAKDRYFNSRDRGADVALGAEPICQCRLGEDGKASILTISTLPNFVGAFMGLREVGEPCEIPAWAKAPEEAPANDEADSERRANG